MIVALAVVVDVLFFLSFHACVNGGSEAANSD